MLKIIRHNHYNRLLQVRNYLILHLAVQWSLYKYSLNDQMKIHRSLFSKYTFYLFEWISRMHRSAKAKKTRDFCQNEAVK